MQLLLDLSISTCQYLVLSHFVMVYYSAMALAIILALMNLTVTHPEYLEGGSSYCMRKFEMDDKQGGLEEHAQMPPPSVPAKTHLWMVSGIETDSNGHTISPYHDRWHLLSWAHSPSPLQYHS